MLKRLKPRHMDIIRRILVGETNQEICMDLGVSESYLSILKGDPVFAARLEMEGEKLHQRFVEQRMDAMQIIDDAQAPIARLAVEAAQNGTINGQRLKPSEQLKSIWDILDRGGTKKAEKFLHGVVNIAELVAEAYQEKHNIKGDDVNCQRTANPEAEPDASSCGAEDGAGKGLPPLLLLPAPSISQHDSTHQPSHNI